MRNLALRIKNSFSISVPRLPVFQCKQNKNILNLCRLDQQNSFLEGIVIVNNILNQMWLYKGLKCCQNVVIADGGANKFFHTPFKDTYKIRSIVGDFDSIEGYVKDYYMKKGVQIQQISEQNTNDFEKAIKKSINNSWNKIFVFGAFGGRMDHALSGMSNTTKLCRQYKDLEMVLVGRENLMYYIRPNKKHEIKISNDIDRKGCGLIRFGSETRVKTTGLKWNLGPSHEFSTLQWGKLISTSNQIIDDTIEVESEGSLFFVAHFKTEQ